MSENVGPSPRTSPALDPFVLCFCLAPLLVALFAALSYPFIGETRYFNEWTALGLLALVATTFGVVWAGLAIRSGVLLMVAFLSNVFTVPRLAEYLWAPSWIYFPFPTFLTASEVNLGLVYYCATLLTFAVGAAIAVRVVAPRGGKSTAPLGIHQGVALVAFLLFLVCEILIQRSAGMADYRASLDNSASVSNLTKLLLVLVSSDTALFVAVLTVLLQNMRRLSWQLILVLVLAIALFIFAYATFGSRGSGVRVVFILVACALCLPWRTMRRTLQLVFLCGFAVAATAAIYPLAENFRTGGDLDQLRRMYEMNMFADEQKVTDGHLVNILNRLGTFDYVAITAARDIDPDCARTYLNLSYVAKNIVNQFAPGNPFPEARSSTSNVFRICLGGRSAEVLSTYHSEVWTLYGVSKSFLGSFALIGCALAGLAAQLGANLLSRGRHDWWRISSAYYLFIIPSSLIYSLGLDHTINTGIILFVRLLVVLAVIQAMMWAWSRALESWTCMRREKV